MDRATAITRMQAMTAWDTEPELTTDEVSALVDMSQTQDIFGLWPTDTGWTTTYNLNIGAAEGWRWKASRAETLENAAISSARVGDVAVSYGGGTASERYHARAEMYRKRIAGTIEAGRYANYPPVEGY